MLIYNSEATFRKAKFSKGGSPEFRDVVECLRVKVLGSITRYFKKHTIKITLKINLEAF